MNIKWGAKVSELSNNGLGIYIGKRMERTQYVIMMMVIQYRI